MGRSWKNPRCPRPRRNLPNHDSDWWKARSAFLHQASFHRRTFARHPADNLRTNLAACPAHFHQQLAQTEPTSVEIHAAWSKPRKNLSNSGQSLSNVASHSGQSWPELGQNGPISADLAQTWPKFKRTWSNSPRLGRIRATVGLDRANFGRVGPNLA